jgi:hypothetical protein
MVAIHSARMRNTLKFAVLLVAASRSVAGQTSDSEWNVPKRSESVIVQHELVDRPSVLDGCVLRFKFLQDVFDLSLRIPDIQQQM